MQCTATESSLVYLVSCGVSDVHPRLSCVVPEHTHSLTPAVEDVEERKLARWVGGNSRAVSQLTCVLA